MTFSPGLIKFLVFLAKSFAGRKSSVLPLFNLCLVRIYQLCCSDVIVLVNDFASFGIGMVLPW